MECVYIVFDAEKDIKGVFKYEFEAEEMVDKLNFEHDEDDYYHYGCYEVLV